MERPIAEVFEKVGEVSNFEASIRTNGSSKRDFLIDFYPYQEEDRVIAVGVVLKDVTELRHLERELRRLMDELQHRVKNTPATVSSIVSRTMNDQVGRTDLVDKLKSRIGALASTHIADASGLARSIVARNSGYRTPAVRSCRANFGRRTPCDGAAKARTVPDAHPARACNQRC